MDPGYPLPPKHTSNPTDNYLLAPRKSTSNPTTAKLLALAIAKPSTVSPYDQMLLEPNNQRKHHELVPSHAPHLAAHHHDKLDPQMC
ncbi:hypothetical protein LIER_44085 [Lithospermum erythrorhizon]|uniref:Uncharacterized protein n=1 Tax=Lithospermum erythrorhizon TaxID=34254 RepID=A0AAV3PAX6_LITER